VTIRAAQRYARRIAVLAGAIAAVVLAPAAAHANAITAENALPGTPPEIWDVPGAPSTQIQGFATDISVDQGHDIGIKVDTPAGAYRLDIYRLGYYQGNGARKVDTIQLTSAGAQPPCGGDGSTGLIDCDNWSLSAAWHVPANATSGIYFAHAVREDGPAGESHIPFVVRDDDGHSDLLFQTSDTTWQAYNQFGGNSLYVGSPVGRAVKASYNRPFTTRGSGAEDWLFNAEYPMVRWLERNGYDVSYFTGADTDRIGGELAEHRAFLSVGHDEYWSGQQRANVEAARSAGVNLGFFSGNEVFWKTRWEDDHRTLVCYKTTHGTGPDPTGTWTGSWRDDRTWNPEGPRPENALTGTSFEVNEGTSAIEVPAADGKLRFWRNTSVAGLGDGDAATLADSTLGYEWDEDLDNGARPAGLVRMSSTTRNGVEVLLDQGSLYGSGSATHHLTLYRDQSGALVFGAGTVQWPWGLDDYHDRGAGAVSPAMQQATVNLFADMGAQPATLQPGLQPAAETTDRTPPVSQATAVALGNPATASGTATDIGGGRVGAVEVSTDGGASWHPAAGRENWTYSWTPPAPGPVSVLTRAADDSANLWPPRPAPATPGGGVLAGGGGPALGGDRRAPRVRVGPKRVRVSRKGRVKLHVRCPAGEVRCTVRLRLLRGRKQAGSRRVTVAGGHVKTVSVKLTRATRHRLQRVRFLRVTAVAVAVDAAGNRMTTATPIRLLRPRRA
jgi:hypothetical protein